MGIIPVDPYDGALVAGVSAGGGAGALGRDAQPALVIGRHYVTQRDSAPVQYNGIV